ncbi:Arm DNA-binding domain-containing protein [Bacteroides eggerthii]|uniref:Arm DNA-binding domain protein n=1 Tax=Bacteroides eggerthii TaxID=28111 RepID=A0A975Q4A5_9BACE|nr:Arm DNA-binding domain-containing protein [Bacteroides eggerthii]QUT43225.1 Arm DNA-binding domain protein [Bacteroides eggerthii]
MARPKKQVKLKEPIKIRLKSLADGNKSIYLDIYYKGVRKYEYLKLYLVPEINPICKEQNKQTMAIAERIKAERIKALRWSMAYRTGKPSSKVQCFLTTWIKKYC